MQILKAVWDNVSVALGVMGLIILHTMFIYGFIKIACSLMRWL